MAKPRLRSGHNDPTSETTWQRGFFSSCGRLVTQMPTLRRGQEEEHQSEEACVPTRDRQWASMPTPISAHANGFWVGMGTIFLFMGGHRWAWLRYYWAWVGMGSIYNGWAWVCER
jgi:hypothetical protein